MIAATADDIQVSAEIFENAYLAVWRASPDPGLRETDSGPSAGGCQGGEDGGPDSGRGGLAIQQPVRHDAGNALRARE